MEYITVDVVILQVYICYWMWNCAFALTTEYDFIDLGFQKCDENFNSKLCRCSHTFRRWHLIASVNELLDSCDSFQMNIWLFIPFKFVMELQICFSGLSQNMTIYSFTKCVEMWSAFSSHSSYPICSIG